MAMPDVREALKNRGMDPFETTPEQFTGLLKSDIAKYGRILKAANIKLD